MLDDYGWELYNAHRFRDAVDAGTRRRPRCTSGSTTRSPSRTCLVRVSRHLFMAGRDRRGRGVRRPRRARSSSRPATPPRWRRRRCYRGAILALTDEPERAARLLERARDARACAPTAATSPRSRLNYLGIAARRARRSRRPASWCATASRLALDGPHHEVAARGYCNLAELLLPRGAAATSWRRASPRASPFARERGFWSHAYNLEAAPLRAAAAPRRPRRRARGPARAGRTASRTRACCSPTACPGSAARWRGAATRRPAGCWPGPGSGAQRQRLLLGVALRGPRLGGVGVAGRAAGDRRARRGLARAAARAPRRRAVPRRAGCATSRAPASPPEPFDGCPSRGRRGPARRLARGRRRLGGARAIPTSRRSS